MKVAIISYHKNIDTIYPKEWIEQYRDSILRQTLQADIIEMNYGGGEYRIFPNGYRFFHIAHPTFVDAMNTLLHWCFANGYDYVLNTNADDIYNSQWAAKTIKMLSKGYDLVSCNFTLIDEKAIPYHVHRFHNMDIRIELSRDHNIICHPGVGYSKKFWDGNIYYPKEIPREDMMLWKRAIQKGYQFVILEDNLVQHRVHSKSVSSVK